ncbi:hypothetical protein HF086_012013 [Spodoptera exigua]|uniref:Uncharacterized protein n=1 Tax=Spodoptera exigua TaxID=7107 RepID=A0A922SH19_SPOEX|nr:hypothetical protein HF086_012013 [Spodoptera exigua]
MVPVVYITRLDDLKIFRMSPFDKIRNKNIIDAVTMKNLPIKKEKISEKETEDVIENNPIKPADDDIENMSTDEDSNDSVVPENMRVKPTSYLLQKPRCRSYNPIQLCKNPDFNTRLKRLTVGFFKSHRNRALIKHCKPLTIDISKAFETKLVKGTLYLKRSEISDVNITTEITDDSEIVQSATVVPSAMIAQSLIDNTKTADILPLIREAEAPPKPIEHERNTRINLPDISEIRRINQRLLIAEISPIQIQNRTFKAPVTLVSNSDPQSPAVSNPTPDVTEVQTVASNYTSCQVVNSLPEPSIRGRAGVLRGRGRGSFSWRSFVQQKPKPKSVKSYTTITWLSKSNDPNIISKQQECTLLTLDTLNKMLNLLGDKEGPSDTQKKSKFTVESTEKKLDKDLLQDGNKIETGVVCKPRINVKSAVNGPRQYKPRKKRVIVNVTNKTVPVNEERQKRKGLYCCWCRKRLLQMILDKKYVRGHDCPEGNCVCCCRKLLSSYILQDEKIKAAQQNADKNMATIQCAEAASACANITKDIPKDAQNQAGPAVTKVSATDIIMPSVSTVTVDSGGQFDIHLPKESSTLGSEVTVAASSKEPATTPFVENVSVAKNPTIAVPLVNTLVSPMIEAQPVLQPITDVNLKKIGLLKTFINSSGKKPNRSTLTKSNKPFKPPKFLKEKLIFLNSKHISDKPAKSPIYLGKNKVLMTTIKFPWNLKLFEETKKALAPTLKLPAGVSLVCLPDGTISYSIDNNHVKALDLALMPSIIATVQMHMNNALQQHRLQLQQNVQPTVNSSEVIDLVDDEDEDENKTKNVLDINNSRNTNEIENVVLTKTTCTEDNAQEASREEMPIATAEQLVHTDVSPSREVSIEKESKHPDSSFTSGCQLRPLSIDDANSKKSELKLPEDQSKPCHANLPESIEATLESEQSLGNENKAEQEVLVAQAPSSSSQADSVTDTQEMPKVPGQPNQTEANASQESKPPEVQSQPDQLIEKPPSENIADSDQNTQQPKKTKNILSDLMEMSGIFDDDVIPPPPVTLPTPAQQVQASQSLLSQLGASPQPVGTSKLQGTLLGPIPNLISCQPLIKTPLGDLSPVTSLYELKYACANKGIFFKLDCDTGYLVPINVCLKAPVKQQKVKVIAERTVIDLTEEGKSNQSEPNLSPEKGLVSDTEGSNSHVKPVSLLKVAVPSILRRLNTNNKSKEKINKGIKAAGDKVIKKKRKQQLQQYDLSDDNEDNIAQSSSKKAMKRSKGADTQELSADKLQQDEVTTLYDSSDDEPLSKVAKLKRQEEEESLSKENQMTKIVAEMPTTEQDEKLDDNLDTEENISESDQSHSSDDDRENCILGV